jgi:hypothetical protein
MPQTNEEENHPKGVNMLDLELRVSRPIMLPKNLSGH